jgi:ATP-binding protein involved in chromosome partitioning
MIEKILEALGHVDDPDLKKDIVTLGMVEGLKLEGNTVYFRLVLTTPACPLKDMIKNACINAIRHFVDKNLEVDIEFGSRVTTNIRSGKQSLPGIKNIIAVGSGKGGVGKSTIATNLAIALGQSGAKVGLLDADIYGPSLPAMMGLRGQQPEIVQNGDKAIIIPFEKFGIKAISIGLLMDERQALLWRGPMISTALKQLILDVAWGEIDYLVVDLPPGTGDIQMTLAQQFPLSAAVIVTTPQQVSVADTRKSIEMFRHPALNIPILGIVENMSWFSPLELPGSKYRIFGSGGGAELAEQYGVPLLAEIPLYGSLAEDADKGLPAILNENVLISADFQNMAENVARQISTLNGTGPGEV